MTQGAEPKEQPKPKLTQGPRAGLAACLREEVGSNERCSPRERTEATRAALKLQRKRERGLGPAQKAIFLSLQKDEKQSKVKYILKNGTEKAVIG